MKKFLSLFLVLTTFMSCFSSCKSNNKPARFFGADGNELASLSKISELKKSEYGAYLDIVIDEAVDILSDLYDINDDDAENKLISQGYSVYTVFDNAVFESLRITAKEHDKLDIGASITDHSGNLLAVLSSEFDDDLNFATQLNVPCSAFKPLSVYSQAIDSGKVNWSTVYEDSPYKKIKG